MPALLTPTLDQVKLAAFDIVDSAVTPRNAAGRVSSDQVRAYLVRSTKRTVDGASVSLLLRTAFGAPVEGYYSAS